jgi:uroporphyrin-3 C-methyltransferase
LNTPSPPITPRRSSALAWLLLLLALPLAGWLGWRAWQSQRDEQRLHAASQLQRVEALESRIDVLRRDQRAQAQRLQQAVATNRVLRDELLGIAQRAALLEDSLDRLADPERSGAQALRLDEVELLLAQGRQRLQIAGDLDGARRLYALAAQLLDGIADPAYLGLRQVLAQERAALDALGTDPKVAAAGKLEAFAASLPALPLREDVDAQARQSWWRRVFARVVNVRRSDAALAVDPADRSAGYAALQLELTLARACIERRDVVGYRAALARADAWLQRLWPPSATQRGLRTRLHALRALPLAVELPTLGSTLEQLRSLRTAR